MEKEAFNSATVPDSDIWAQGWDNENPEASFTGERNSRLLGLKDIEIMVAPSICEETP